MDSAAGINLSSSPKFIKSTNLFETEFKERLKWSKSKWISSGENGTRMNKLCNSIIYWKKKLKPAVESKSIVFTLFNYEKDVRVELFNIVSVVESLDVSFLVKGFADFRNPRYLCLYFDSEQIRDRVFEKFWLFEDSFVVYMSWALVCESMEVRLNVHWLPMTVNIGEIKQALNEYVVCVEEERKKLKFLSGREMPSGKLSFKVTVKKDILIENIPHVLEIAKMEALVTVSGRRPLCLNCDVIGHISRDCQLRYCDCCRTLKPKGHVCRDKLDFPSYADKVKEGGGKGLQVEPDDYGTEIVVEYDKKLDVNNELANKISELENKLKFAKAAEEYQIRARLDHKWKAELLGQAGLDEQEETDSSSVSMEEEGSISDRKEEEVVPDNKTEHEDVMLTQSFEQEDGSGTVNKKKKKKKKVKIQVSECSGADNSSSQEIIVDNNAEGLIRSYGRPVMDNARRQRENKAFDKLFKTQEFVFQDSSDPN